MAYTDVAAGLRDASLALCASTDIRSRLEAAHACLVAVDGNRLPGSLHVRFDELVADLTYGGENVRDALAVMNPVDQQRLAERVVLLYGDLCSWLPLEE